jgi:acetoin utilization protein AcuB
VPALSPKDETAKAARIMTDYRVRALPIVDDGEIVGQVNAQSICKALISRGMLDFAVAKIMTDRPVTLHVNDSLAKAKTVMISKNIDHLPVFRDEKLVGVLTSQRLLEALVPAERPMRDKTPETLGINKLSVRGLMESPFMVDAQEAASSVLNKLIDNNMTCALVQIGQKLQGIVTYRDFVKIIARRRRSGLPIYIIGLPEGQFESEMARTKLSRAVNLIRKSFPDILEARATIKVSGPQHKSGRKRYEVKASLYTPRRVIVFSESGWDLAAVFDEIIHKLKRKMTKRRT